VARYVLKRLAIAPLLLIGIVTIAFLISRLIPADPLVSIVGERNMGNPTVVAAAEQQWGLDKSLPAQYATYMGNLAQGDFGTSFRTKSSVWDDLTERLPATAELTLAALLFGVVAGIGLGVVAAVKRDRAPDHVARLFALTGSSIPVFWLGLILLFVFYARLGWLPGPGRLPPRTDPPAHMTGLYTIDSLAAGNFSLFWECSKRLIMPAFVLGWGLTGIVSRLIRASMLDELYADYVRTARAKGLTERSVMIRHVLRNALMPTITIVGLSFGALLTGAVLTETIFSWNGIGSYAVEATRTLDYPAINGVCILGGAIFILTSLATDVLYAVADPKIRLS